MKQTFMLFGLLLVAPAVDDTGVDVAFSTPAHFVGTVEAMDTHWALLVFPRGNWTADATLLSPVALEEHAYTAVHWPRSSGGGESVLLSRWGEPTRHGSPHPEVRMRSTEAWSTLFIRAGDITVVGGETTLALENGPARLDPKDTDFGTRVPHHAFRPQPVEGDQPVLFGRQPVPTLQLQVEGLHSVEMRGAVATCGGEVCASSSTEGGDGSIRHTTAWRWWSAGGSLTVTAHDVIVWTGGAGMQVTASGTVRLPGLQTGTDVGQLGVSVHGQTLRGQGNLTLSDVHTSPDHTGHGRLSTALVAARLDESPLDVQAVASVPSAAATAALLGLLLWKGKAVASFLVGLFTRFDMDAALEHPNRRALFDYIDENPGASFRELIRATGLASGTARHHLAMLARCDVVVERPFGQTLRYFHCDQEQIGDWDAVVVLREPDLDRMYRWLLDHPGVMQRQILDAAESWGWRRSTAQHRLRRLVQNNLALVRNLGRFKSYRARVVDVR